MNILNQIIADKNREVIIRKAAVPISHLEASVLFNLPTISLSENLRRSNSGIIAEYKRRSPSKSIINERLSVEEVVQGYENAGACGISVLTDEKYFGGSLDDLLVARDAVNLPILRKEFIVDEYQIIEAKAYGADAILLIASVLTKEEIKRFSEFAKSLNLEVILEVHNLAELQNSIMPTIDIVGVNNRNLDTFEVNLSTSKKLSPEIPDEFVKISESGISSVSDIIELATFGFQGFLIGENFMKTDNPGEAAKKLITNLQSRGTQIER